MNRHKFNFAFIPRFDTERVHLYGYRSCHAWLSFRRDLQRFDMSGIVPSDSCLAGWISGVRPVALYPTCYRILTG